MPRPGSKGVRDSITTVFPDGRMHAALMQRLHQFGNGPGMAGDIGGIDAYLAGPVGVAGADGGQAKFPAPGEGQAVGGKICAAVENFHAVEAADVPQMLLQSPVVAAEGMAGHTEAACRTDLADKVLGGDAGTGKSIDSKCSNVTPEGIVLHTYKNGKSDLPAVCLGLFPESHAVVVGNTDAIQPPGLCGFHDLSQRHAAVTGTGGFMDMHIKEHAAIACLWGGEYGRRMQ